MAEVIARDGTWTFDYEIVRIVPGRDRGVHKLRQALGELTVPLAAIAGIAYQTGRKGGRLRMRLREGADPLLQAAGGRLADAADPYQLAVDAGRAGAAEYFVDEVRNALLLEGVPDGPCDRYLLPGPPVPLTASGGEGTATFDGERVRLEWNWMAEESKRSAGAQQFAVKDLVGVEWNPTSGLENGHLRFRLRNATVNLPPAHDPSCLRLFWATQKETGTTVLVAAAVLARLPHPSGATDPQPALDAVPEAPDGASLPTGAAGAGTGTGTGDEDPDALLRRLRELGELNRDGLLTDEEFAAAKQALLSRFRAANHPRSPD
jgi:Domain of unknown function (DUF4429)